MSLTFPHCQVDIDWHIREELLHYESRCSMKEMHSAYHSIRPITYLLKDTVDVLMVNKILRKCSLARFYVTQWWDRYPGHYQRNYKSIIISIIARTLRCTWTWKPYWVISFWGTQVNGIALPSWFTCTWYWYSHPRLHCRMKYHSQSQYTHDTWHYVNTLERINRMESYFITKCVPIHLLAFFFALH